MHNIILQFSLSLDKKVTKNDFYFQFLSIPTFSKKFKSFQCNLKKKYFVLNSSVL